MQRFLVLLTGTAAVGLAQVPNKCGDLAKFQMPGNRIEITRAEMVTAGQATGERGGLAGPVLPTRAASTASSIAELGRMARPTASG